MDAPTLAVDRQVLADQIERSIHERTNGMVRGLRIEFVEGEVVLSGRTRTYYTKQLAQHAALAAVDRLALTNEIEVH